MKINVLMKILFEFMVFMCVEFSCFRFHMQHILKALCVQYSGQHDSLHLYVSVHFPLHQPHLVTTTETIILQTEQYYAHENGTMTTV